MFYSVEARRGRAEFYFSEYTRIILLVFLHCWLHIMCHADEGHDAFPLNGHVFLLDLSK